MTAAAKMCQACDLYKHATQTVFGEGAYKASLMLIVEQPGDAEDLSRHPFVGPACTLLDRALEEAGIDRSAVHITNFGRQTTKPAVARPNGSLAICARLRARYHR